LAYERPHLLFAAAGAGARIRSGHCRIVSSNNGSTPGSRITGNSGSLQKLHTIIYTAEQIVELSRADEAGLVDIAIG
jgi:hypothetical protein